MATKCMEEYSDQKNKKKVVKVFVGIFKDSWYLYVYTYRFRHGHFNIVINDYQ